MKYHLLNDTRLVLVMGDWVTGPQYMARFKCLSLNLAQVMHYFYRRIKVHVILLPPLVANASFKPRSTHGSLCDNSVTALLLPTHHA